MDSNTISFKKVSIFTLGDYLKNLNIGDIVQCFTKEELNHRNIKDVSISDHRNWFIITEEIMNDGSELMMSLTEFEVVYKGMCVTSANNREQQNSDILIKKEYGQGIFRDSYIEFDNEVYIPFDIVEDTEKSEQKYALRKVATLNPDKKEKFKYLLEMYKNGEQVIFIRDLDDVLIKNENICIEMENRNKLLRESYELVYGENSLDIDFDSGYSLGGDFIYSGTSYKYLYDFVSNNFSMENDDGYQLSVNYNDGNMEIDFNDFDYSNDEINYILDMVDDFLNTYTEEIVKRNVV